MVPLLALLAVAAGPAAADECHLTPVIHVLQFPGCTPKPIPSFACAGRCTSYVQVGDGQRKIRLQLGGRRRRTVPQDQIPKTAKFEGTRDDRIL